jgi:hypothetical protein
MRARGAPELVENSGNPLPAFSADNALNPAPESAPNGSLPIRHSSDQKRRTSASKPASRLAVVETVYKGKKAWRVSLGKRGKDLLSFRVRPSGSGFFVSWRSGTTERYVCYLSAEEWKAAKRGSQSSFARLIVSKLDTRRDAGESLDKISGLRELAQAFIV